MKKAGEGPLKNVLKTIISGIEEKAQEEENVRKIWEKAAGKKTARHTKVAFLKAKKLVVTVSDSAWLYKLTLEKKNIIEKFN